MYENDLLGILVGFLFVIFLFGVVPALIFRQVDKFRSYATMVYQYLEEYRKTGIVSSLFDSYFEKYLEFKEKVE